MDPLKKLRRPSLVHWLFGPFIRLYGSWKYEREEAKRRKGYKIVGYFVFRTCWTTNGERNGDVTIHCWAAMKDGFGHRKVKSMTAETDRHVLGREDHTWNSYMNAWMNGDDKVETLLSRTPTFVERKA